MTDSTNTSNVSRTWKLLNDKFCVALWIEMFFRAADSLLTPLLWSGCACVTLYCLCFSATPKLACLLEILLAFVSFSSHAVRQFSASWREYPYWRSLQKLRDDRFAISNPILTMNAVLALNLCVNAYAKFAALFFVFSWLYDCVVSKLTRDYADGRLRSFRVLLEESKPLEQDVIQSSDNLTSPDLEEKVDCANNELNSEEADSEEIVLLSQTRSRTKSGEIRISGQLRIEFDADAELAVVFISFCPPFSKTPTFEFESLAEDDVSVKATLVQPFGVRLEARRKIDVLSKEKPNVDFVTLDYFASSPDSL